MDPIDELIANVDIRLLPLWEEFDNIADDATRETVVVFCRAAYARGYTDCFKDPEPSSFFTETGYSVPVRES